MRILCLIPTMTPGGAERMMSYLVGHFADRHDVVLMTFEAPGAASFFPLPSSVRIIQADLLGGRGATRISRLALRIAVIRSAVRDFSPDVLVSFMDMMNVTSLLASLGTRVPVVVSQRNDPSRNTDRLRMVVRDRVYSLADLIVVQTSRIAKYFPASLKPQIRILPNPVTLCPTRATPERPGANGRFRIVSIGRLVTQKGHASLIEAFALIADQRPGWDLAIVGDGPLRSSLEELVRRLGLNGRVNLPGVRQDIAQELAASHLVACPSLYEGFPNALAEALATGLPAIGYKAVSGVEELIVDGKTGLLVDTQVIALAKALLNLTGDADLRSQMGRTAREHVAQFAAEGILYQWDNLLLEAVERRNRVSEG